MRFLDEIRTGMPLSLHAAYVPPAEWMAFTTRLQAALEGLPVIVADNVDQFYEGKFRRDRPGFRDRELVLRDEFPNAAPPFPRFWIEWTPSHAAIREKVSKYAVLVTGVKLESGFLIELLGIARAAHSRNAVVLSRNVQLCTDPQGVCQTLQTSLLHVGEIHPQEEPDWWRDFVFVPMTTMCFMNCRNVQVSWVAPPERLARSFQKKHGKLPTRRIGTVEITPMTRLIAEGTRAAAPGEHRSMAAHICRGHFKHYGADNKLFGKHEGTYFWGAQARNFKSVRDVDHTYRINTQGIDGRATNREITKAGNN